jgi:ribonuclease Z
MQMRPSFLPRLVNGPFDDPGVYIPMTLRKRAILFDLGDVSALSHGDLLKISHVFVTHTHMDHFIGFDRILRLMLGRAKTLYLFGPEGFHDNVAAKLRAYTWDLVHNYDESLVISAMEIRHNRLVTRQFRCQNGFTPTIPETTRHDTAIIWQEPGLRIQAALLDHHIPSLAFALQEQFHINILRPALDEMGLQVGPWLNRFKSLLFDQADPATAIKVAAKDRSKINCILTLGQLSEKIARITPGQKIAYVADAVYSDANEKKIVSLAQDADHLFIEAAFLDAHQDIAKAKHHLTARQAGTLARKANVREMTIFHHSPRYREQEDLLRREAHEAFTCP